MQIVCPECGEQDTEGAPYCLNPGCGALLVKLETPQPRRSEPTNPVPAPPPSGLSQTVKRWRTKRSAVPEPLAQPQNPSAPSSPTVTPTAAEPARPLTQPSQPLPHTVPLSELAVPSTQPPYHVVPSEPVLPSAQSAERVAAPGEPAASTVQPGGFIAAAKAPPGKVNAAPTATEPVAQPKHAAKETTESAHAATVVVAANRPAGGSAGQQATTHGREANPGREAAAGRRAAHGRQVNLGWGVAAGREEAPGHGAAVGLVATPGREVAAGATRGAKVKGRGKLWALGVVMLAANGTVVAVVATRPTRNNTATTPTVSPQPTGPYLSATAVPFCREGRVWSIRVRIQASGGTVSELKAMHVASSGGNAYAYVLTAKDGVYEGEVPPIWAPGKGKEFVLDSASTRWRAEAIVDGQTITFDGGTLTNPC